MVRCHQICRWHRKNLVYEPVVGQCSFPRQKQCGRCCVQTVPQCSDLRGLHMLSRGRNAIFEMHVGAEELRGQSGRKGDALLIPPRRLGSRGLTALGRRQSS